MGGESQLELVGSDGGGGEDHLLCSPFCLHSLGSPRGCGQSLQLHLSLCPCSWHRTLGPAFLSIPGGARPHPPHPVPSPTGSLPLPTFWFSPVLPAHTAAPPPFLAKCYLNSEFCPLANCHLIFSSSWLKAKEYSFQIKMVKTFFTPLARFLCKCSAACC